MKIEYISHASLLISTNQVHFLTDPFYFHDELTGSFNCFYPHRDLSPEYFPDLDYVYCSHVHDDHCHQHTMEQLRDKIKTVIIPAGRADLEQKIRRYGFSKLILLEDEQTLELPEGIRLTCYHDKNGVDSSLVIQAQGETILHQNDCCLDLETFGRMAAKFTIDYAFFPHRGNQDLYPFILPRPEEVLQPLAYDCENEKVNYFVECLRILKPGLLIPYSFTVFFSNDDQQKLNGYHRNRPQDFIRKIKAAIPGQECLVIHPGDFFEGEDDLKFKPQNKTNLWGDSLEEFLKLGHAYCKTLDAAKRHFDYGNIDGVSDGLSDYLHDRFKKPLPDYFYRGIIALHLIDGKGGKKSFYLDAGKSTIESSSQKIPFMEITMPASIARCFLEQKYDPFMLLYSYRVTFEFPALMVLGLNAREECAYYVGTVLALFDT